MSQDVSRVDSNSDNSNNIRRAAAGDIESLIEICRVSFPYALRWRTNRCARKWWEYKIRSKSSETWVYQFNNEIVAMNIMVIDSNSDKEDTRKLRPCFGTLLCVLIVRPQLLVERIVAKITRMTSSSVNYSNSSNLKSLVNKSVWFHSIAVMPNMRGKGMGASIMRFCEQRAVELGFDSVKCTIKTNNNDSIRFHERLGFIRTGKVKDHYSYIKLLSTNSNNKKVLLKAR